VQGLGGAVVSAVALSLIMNLFPDAAGRTRAMGIFGFVCAGGGSLGVLLGGVLTSALSWHWIFLVNLPLGIAVYAAVLALLPADGERVAGARLDVGGAVTVTLSLMLAVYAVVDGNTAGWTSARTLLMLGAAAALMALFVAIESRVASPLMPLSLFALRNVATANVMGVLWAAGMFAWFFVSALYLQQVLGYDALRVGLAFLPGNLVMAVLSVGWSARIVMRFGIRAPLACGLFVAALGLWLFSLAPEGGSFWLHVLPGMVLLGLGAGLAFNPILMAAMSDVPEHESGLASGVVNTSFMMGGALGLAVLASFAEARTAGLRAAGATAVTALNGGYQLAFLLGAGCALLAAVIGLAFMRPGRLAASGAVTAH
jgi:MFS family permease